MSNVSEIAQQVNLFNRVGVRAEVDVATGQVVRYVAGDNQHRRVVAEGNALVGATVDPVTGGIKKIINVETFSDAATVSEKALIFVSQDETNGGQMTAYFHNGQTLNWLPSIEV